MTAVLPLVSELNPAPTSTAQHQDPADNEVLIQVKHVSKRYHLWDSPGARLRFSLLSQAHRSLRSVLGRESALVERVGARRDAIGRDFYALHDVSMEVRRGESVGIIGRNGSGKSTLLQIIAGTLRPTEGTVSVNGRIAALLELGSGFNPEFTGRENVFLNAAVLGLTRAQTEARFDGIAGFADIGPFLDQPVKTYSSGMMVRLAFAVQAAIEPDLFIVDEALAVGDIYFQNKCVTLLRQRLEGGMTLLLVSHDPGSIRALCQRGLVLNRGRSAFFGPSDEAVNVYRAIHSGAKAGGTSGGQPTEADGTDGVDADGASGMPPGRHGRGPTLGVDSGTPSPLATVAADLIPAGFGQIQDEIGDGTMTITGCALFNREGYPAADFLGGEPIRVGMTFQATRDFPARELMVGFAVRDRFNNVVSAATTENHGQILPAVRAGCPYAICLRVPGRLGSGQYLLDVGVGSVPDGAGSPERHHHRHRGVAALSVTWRPDEVAFQGICDLGAEFGPVEPVADAGLS